MHTSRRTRISQCGLHCTYQVDELTAFLKPINYRKGKAGKALEKVYEKAYEKSY